MLLRKKNSIEAGDLKDLCTLFQPTYISDGRGGKSVAFSEVQEVWCKAVPLRNTRSLEEAQLIFNQALVFTIRYGVDIKEDWQIEFNGKTYIIHMIDDIDTRYQYLSIIAYTKRI